jgi:hypothetical protein
MKKMVTLLFVIACSFHGFSQISWGTPVAVYSVDANHNNHPRIALNRAGDPYIIFGQTDTRVYFTKWNGTAFTTPSVASGSLTVFSQSWAGPDIAAYGDTVYVSMKVTPEGTSSNYGYLAHSYDGGSTFSMPVRIDNIGANLSRFPIVTTTSNGNPLVAFMKFIPSMRNAQYAVARSTDYGMSFTAEAIASGTTDSVCDCCPASVISSGSNAIMLYRKNVNGVSDIRDIWTGISNDGGMTFTSHMDVDNNNWIKTSCPASGPDGFVLGDTIYSVFMSRDTSMVYFSKSSISGMVSSTTPLTGYFAGLNKQDYPRIANSSAAAMALWVQTMGASKSIVYSFTNRIASGFSGYTALAGASGSGIMDADVAMAPGAIHIVWEDDNTGKVMYVKGTYTVMPSDIPAVTRELIEVYPNPAGNNFTVSLDNISKISYSYLVDITGRHIELVPSVKNGKAVFSVNSIAKGNYYFVLSDDAGKQYYSKVVLR